MPVTEQAAPLPGRETGKTESQKNLKPTASRFSGFPALALQQPDRPYMQTVAPTPIVVPLLKSATQLKLIVVQMPGTKCNILFLAAYH
ncbi:MAG: hypothetical protein J7539_07260 [Niabella sp.]|nr:hypothetical protein [Niabella sp.]